MYIYLKENDKWNKVGKQYQDLKKRKYFSTVSLNDNVFFFGGQDSSGNSKVKLIV